MEGDDNVLTRTPPAIGMGGPAGGAMLIVPLKMWLKHGVRDRLYWMGVGEAVMMLARVARTARMVVVGCMAELFGGV